MEFYLIKQYDSESISGDVRHEGFAITNEASHRYSDALFDPAIDFIIYVAM